MSYHPNTQTSFDLAKRLESVRANAAARRRKRTRKERFMAFLGMFLEAVTVGASIGIVWFVGVAWLVFVR